MTNEEFIKNVSLEGEEWRDVVGYEGLYMVSSFGRVISLGRTVTNNLGSRKQSSKFLSESTFTNSGYKQVRLWKNNKENHIYIHRLVAKAFIPNPNEYPCVDHIDTNRTNNHVSNLRWCTYSMNSMNPVTNERSRKSKIGNRKLSLSKSKSVVRINPDNENDIKIYESARVAQIELTGSKNGHISCVCIGRRNLYAGYKWMFLSDYEALINKSKNENQPKQD